MLEGQRFAILAMFLCVIVEINSCNIALLDKYTEHPVFALGSILWNIAPREWTVKYCPPREGNAEYQLFQYHPALKNNTNINYNGHFIVHLKKEANWL